MKRLAENKILAEASPVRLSAGEIGPGCLGPFLEMGIFSDCLKNIIKQAQVYHTDRNMPVLIEGETGTGKEGVARAIHCGLAANSTPFINVDCAALAPDLFDSELFGNEADSFAGNLMRGRKGKVELAIGGTLFLDEIAEIPLEQQGKLMRLMQEKEFYRVGGVRKIKADVRFVCATNLSLEHEVKEGRFRKDLYYRLRVGYIMVPPLRRRREEILPLACMFMNRYACAKGKKFSTIAEEAASMLLGYDWPGNIRELRNVIELGILMYDDVELTAEHIKSLIGEGESMWKDGAPLLSAAEMPDIALPEIRFPLEDYIDSVVCKALAMHHGNRTKTANYLGISRRVLSYRLERMKNRAPHE